MDWSWLIALMCSLMMLPMILLMMKENKSEQSASDEQQTKMKMELEMLKDQNNTMSKILEQVKQKRVIEIINVTR
ncbi:MULTISPECIES: hypothetical protein [Brevibacillus]|uniref:hypothetical protein n=1 Tax=Brevibacillus TaxID=55080 RepID=UPI000B9AEDF4|nr:MULTISPECIES: hypothetical protein [Brevibacillus]MBG9789131.1 hypothetical protein [Brevibacillus laterosporus]MCG7317798.1 hypothetical protein [Brevibacillus laterosporus]MED1790292.1 hypothetical protein [Brevibacillus laterosporus]RFB32503.1 hypothetical protein DZB91_16670 [Brevibacillus sp. VP]